MDEWKSVFNTLLGQGVPGVSMNLINEVLQTFSFKGVVYLDDILIYSHDYQGHVKLVCEVLKTLNQNKLLAKLSVSSIRKN